MMQILSLISNDRFLSNLNVSIPTDNLIDRLNDFISIFQYNEDPENVHPVNMQASWKRFHETLWTRILHKTGFCYTFNFPNANQVFKLEKVSNDFHYNQIIRMNSYLVEKENQISSYPLHFSPNGGNLFGEFNAIHNNSNIMNETWPNEDRDGFLLFFHDPFEIPSVETAHFMTAPHELIEFQIKPEILSFDESFNDAKQKV
jgi:hypothetical protein